MLHCSLTGGMVTDSTKRKNMIQHIGVSQLAKEVGRTPSAVSQALSRGKTVEEIREAARRTDERRLAGKARGKQAGGKQPPKAGTSDTPNAPTGYVPARMAGTGSGGSRGSVLLPVPSPAPARITPVAQLIDRGDGIKSLPPGDGPPIESLAEAEKRKAIALANERELIVAQKRKELVPVKEVNQWFSGQIVVARNMLTRIPGEMRDRLAAETDPVKCEAMLMDEIVRVLKTLKEMTVE